MADQNTSEGLHRPRNTEAPDQSTQTDARAKPARPEAGTASGARDDRNDEVDESPVPDPEEQPGDADDDPGAD